MSLNLTYADNADQVRKHRRQKAAKTVAALLFLLLLVAALGFFVPYPIHAY